MNDAPVDLKSATTLSALAACHQHVDFVTPLPEHFKDLAYQAWNESRSAVEHVHFLPPCGRYWQVTMRLARRARVLGYGKAVGLDARANDYEKAMRYADCLFLHLEKYRARRTELTPRHFNFSPEQAAQDLRDNAAIRELVERIESWLRQFDAAFVEHPVRLSVGLRKGRGPGTAQLLERLVLLEARVARLVEWLP